MPATLAEKIWTQHLVRQGAPGAEDLVYIDLHLLHEVTSSQAFEGLRAAGRPLRRPDLTFATEDHNVPTTTQELIEDPMSRIQLESLRANCAEFGVPLASMGDADQGIVFVMGPERGLVHPGMTVVCGDSHTSTLGAFGALAFGVGTSQVEHVMATQTLPMKPFRTMAVEFLGSRAPGVTAKDMALAVMGAVGTSGGTGHVIEYRGEAVRELSMEGRLTLCNMSIEAGARAGMISPDQTTFDHLRGRPFAPTGAAWDDAVREWEQLATDDGARFDSEVVIDLDQVRPQITWGTTPAQVVPITGTVPAPTDLPPGQREAAERALRYMDLTPGQPLLGTKIDRVFLGSCTNGRLEDLRAAADVLRGRTVAGNVQMIVVPGSERVRRAAMAEGLDEVFTAAGASWRFAGCSMCLGMNPDRSEPEARVVSTSNRNFESRQGPRARTHLTSPAVAAASAVVGAIADPGEVV